MNNTIYIIFFLTILVFIIQGGILYAQIPIMYSLLDYFIPLNESRQKISFTLGVHPFDQYQYYYELGIFYNVVTFVLLNVVLSTDSTFVTLMHQSLGLFATTK